MAKNKRCPKCGTPMLPNALFCGNCGCSFADAPKKSGKKILIVVIVSVVVLAALVGVVLYMVWPFGSDQAQAPKVDNNEISQPQGSGTDDPAVDTPIVDDTAAEAEKVPIIERGDIITLGHYEQDNNTANGAEEIQWIVLEVQDGKALVISKYALDSREYNLGFSGTSWGTSQIRQWLNADFMGEAFTEEEQEGIIETTVVNHGNELYGTVGGNNTQDRLFFLSVDEAEEYFALDEERTGMPTAYAIAKGIAVKENGECYWWLRTPGDLQHKAAGVGGGGSIDYDGAITDYRMGGVRPAMWIELD